MALGGGTFITQNKVLPGSYINFISSSNTGLVFGDRGICAAPLNLDWGPDDEVIEVTAEDFEKNSVRIMGYAYTDGAMKPYRDLFKNAQKCYFYRVSGGNKATSDYATAKYAGARGNDIKIVIQKNIDDTDQYDVLTYLSDTLVDKQTVVSANGLEDNEFVDFIKSCTLEETAGTSLTGGTSIASTGLKYQEFLDKTEQYYFNVLVCDSGDDTIKGLFANHTKRLRDKVGVKFQTVVYEYDGDYEGLINLTTSAQEKTEALVWWVAGIEASCAINKSCTNKKYDGEYTPICNDTQAALENAINNGELKFHKVGSDYRILTDINSLVTTTSEKSNLFCLNQTVRVCDQIAVDISTIFNTYYLGIMPNDKAGRTSLWGDIVKHMKTLETLRAIEDFKDTDVFVEQGEDKRAVVVTMPINVVNTMEQLYMTVKVN